MGGDSHSSLLALSRCLGQEFGLCPRPGLLRARPFAGSLGHPEEGRLSAFSQVRRGGHQNGFRHVHQRAGFQGTSNVLFFMWGLVIKCANLLKIPQPVCLAYVQFSALLLYFNYKFGAGGFKFIFLMLYLFSRECK